MSEPQKLASARLAEIAAYVETARHSRGGAAFSDRALPDLLAHIAALEQMATVKGALNYCVLANAERDVAIARAEVLEAERDEWRKRCVDAEVHRARAAISTAKEPGHE